MINFTTIRDALAATPNDVSSTIVDPPSPNQIYAPPDHGAALDPSRALVVGARGMGKSFWAAAYTSQAARTSLSDLYPRLGLDKISVSQGFTGEEGGAAPSKRVLGRLIEQGHRADDIWRAVVLGAIAPKPAEIPWTDWLLAERDIEATERNFATINRQQLARNGKTVVVFDALDKLADNWPSIRELTLGLLRTALDMRAYRGIGLKIFMRADQFDDGAVFGFPDASKLKAEAVRLEWSPRDLYGLLFTNLARSEQSADSFAALATQTGTPLESLNGLITLPIRLREDSSTQEKLFSRIAGTYMGADHRRGRTYTWLTNHLTDARGEASPRSFLRASAEAARFTPAPARSAIDAAGIREGIIAASQVRFAELLEDHGWARRALLPLADQSVPCDDSDFFLRWRTARTIEQIRADEKSKIYLGPVELVERRASSESALLEALIRLGVVERRGDGRINMPDIYRVAAALLRRGGVRPRRR